MIPRGVVAGAAVGVLFLVWLVVSLGRAGRRSRRGELGAQARDALTRFADRALEIENVHDILVLAKDTAWRLFGSSRVVAFESGADRGAWDAFIPGGEALAPVPASLRGLFAWFVHNRTVASLGDLGDKRFGAMRAPLREIMDRYQVDLVIPLVQHGRLLAVIGLLLERRPTPLDREVLILFRLEATAACANVNLHRQAAHVLTLAKELDLASAVKLALVPDESEGASGSITWSGHFEGAGQAASDFWGAYILGDGKLMFVIGDAVGSGLGGSMVAAVVKSCCDGVYDGNPGGPGPAQLLGALNGAIFRPTSPSHTRCFAAMFDPPAQRVIYANAGHTVPYRLPLFGKQELGVLAGAGPLLGDSADAVYRENRSPLVARECFVLFTDGLVKARNPDGEPFGDRRLQRVLAGHKDASARDIRETVLGALTAWRDRAPLADDIALVVIRVKT
jgi:sigma-B regulation protein RsbU (phosphoserine phosphatase)